MKISEKALSQINNQTARLTLALALGFSETWVRGLITKNKENGPLTTAKAIQIIKEQTGLRDSEILEETEVRA